MMALTPALPTFRPWPRMKVQLTPSHVSPSPADPAPKQTDKQTYQQTDTQTSQTNNQPHKVTNKQTNTSSRPHKEYKRLDETQTCLAMFMCAACSV